MPSKSKVIEDKETLIAKLQKAIDGIKCLELNRLYKWNWSGGDGKIFYGILETFNKESCRLRVIATDEKMFAPSTYTGRHRTNAYSMGYEFVNSLDRVQRQELPLILGLPYKHSELDPIMSGKSRVKLD